MSHELEVLKGIHPGIVLDRKLKERKISKGRFALLMNEYPQTLGAITKGKRNMNTALALKIEQALDLAEGFFMTLQIFYEIKQKKTEDVRKIPPRFIQIKKRIVLGY